jgi:hypothetical protein
VGLPGKSLRPRSQATQINAKDRLSAGRERRGTPFRKAWELAQTMALMGPGSSVPRSMQRAREADHGNDFSPQCTVSPADAPM